MREKVQPWIPAAFCATLALITTVSNLSSKMNGGDGNAGTIVFVCFMPMCFFFAAAYVTQLRNEIREMRSRLDALNNSKQNGPPTSAT